MQEIIDMVNDLQTKEASSEEYQAFETNIQNEDFCNAMCRIVLNQEIALRDRQIIIFTIKAFHLFIPVQCLEQLFPLIADESVQKFIAQLFIASYDKETINTTIFPILYENIAIHTTDLSFLKGSVYFFSEYIDMYKTRNINIMNALFEILTQRADLDNEFMTFVLDTIIKQMLLIPHEYEEIRNNDLYSVIQLLKNIDLENTSIAIIEHILALINERTCYYDTNDILDDEAYEKLIEILDLINAKCPLSPSQFEITTPLFYLIRIFKLKNYLIPFEKLLPILVMSDEQINLIENDVNYALNPIIDTFTTHEFQDDEEDDDQEIDTSNSFEQMKTFGGEIQSTNEEEEDYSFEYDDISDDSSSIQEEDNDEEIQCVDIFWAKNSWKCLNRLETLNDTQNLVRNYIVTRSDDYIQEVIEMCSELINQNENINLPMLLLFKEIGSMIDYQFDPFEFNTFDNSVIQYLLLEYCNSKMLQCDINEPNLFFSFIEQIDFDNFAVCMLSSDEPTNILCMFKFIIICPRELIHPSIYANVLLKVITVVLPRLQYIEDKADLIEKMFDFLSPGESLTQSNENYVLSLDKSVREKKSKSIFCLDEEYALAFKDEDETFFGQALMPVIVELMDFKDIIFRIAKLIKYFAGGNIRKFVSRHNRESDEDDETLVDLTNYSLYFPDIVHMFQELLQRNIWKEDTMINYFALFSQVFINIFVPNDETVMSIIDESYNEFVSMDLPSLFKIPAIESVLRIFIKYGKFENLDMIVFNIIESDNSYVNTLIYEISSILMNQNQVYSDEIVFGLSILIRNLIRQDPRMYIKSIVCILARVALFSVERFEALMEGEDIEELILHLIDILSLDSFKYYCELEQRMIIAFFGLYSINEQIAQTTQKLLIAMMKSLDEVLSEPNNEIGSFEITSSLALIKESIFYDDDDFLSHPFISASLSNLIHELQADELVDDFFEKYPAL